MITTNHMTEHTQIFNVFVLCIVLKTAIFSTPNNPSKKELRETFWDVSGSATEENEPIHEELTNVAAMAKCEFKNSI